MVHRGPEVKATADHGHVEDVVELHPLDHHQALATIALLACPCRPGLVRGCIHPPLGKGQTQRIGRPSSAGTIVPIRGPVSGLDGLRHENDRQSCQAPSNPPPSCSRAGHSHPPVAPDQLTPCELLCQETAGSGQSTTAAEQGWTHPGTLNSLCISPPPEAVLMRLLAQTRGAFASGGIRQSEQCVSRF